METALTHEQIKHIIFSELPKVIEKDPKIRRYILKISKEKYADKEKTEDRIDRILDELKRDREAGEKKWAEWNLKWEKYLEESKLYREAQDKKWAEWNLKWEKHLEESKLYREAQDKKWAEQDVKWEENQKTIRQILDSITTINKKHESSIGALGARWGMHAESAFRDGLKAILEQSFKVKVERYEDFDDKGMVFGRPDQIEMDVIVYNGTLILCEIKSSLSKSEVYTFWRKTQFYEERHQRKANRKIVISPMLSPKAISVAKELNIETYGYADEVPTVRTV